jgi:hypothetical protein
MHPARRGLTNFRALAKVDRDLAFPGATADAPFARL